jgi:hypothetical protein
MSSKKLQAQVKRLMRMRQEKKYAERTASGPVGQVNVNVDGALVADVTPSIGQGDGEGQRIGNSITGTGFVFKQHFIKQEAGIGPRRVRTHIVRTLDPTLSGATLLAAVLDLNPISGHRDYFSSLNYTMMSDKRVQVLGTAETKLMSNYDDNMIQVNERATGNITVPVKFEDQTIRYEGDAATEPASIRYFAITLCDNGNGGGSTSAASVFVPTAASGVDCRGYSRLWYTDA